MPQTEQQHPADNGDHELAWMTEDDNDFYREVLHDMMMDQIPTPSGIAQAKKSEIITRVLASQVLSDLPSSSLLTEEDVNGRLLVVHDEVQHSVEKILSNLGLVNASKPAQRSAHSLSPLHYYYAGLKALLARIYSRQKAEAPTVEKPQIPTNALFLLSLTLSNEERVPVLGDVEERFMDQCKRFGVRQAKIDIWQNTASSVVPFFWTKAVKVFKALGLGGLGVALMAWIKMKIG